MRAPDGKRPRSSHPDEGAPMTTPSPAARSGAPAPKRNAWRPVVIWSVFLMLLAAGLVLALVYGPTVTSLAELAAP
jgi:hypothetical protein